MNKREDIPDWMLERFLLDELPRKERRHIERELERDPGLRAELEKLRLSDRQALAAYPPDQVIPQILKRAALTRTEPAAPRRWRLAWMAAPALALALLLLVILPPILQQRLAPPEGSRAGEYTGTKGGDAIPGPALRLFRKSGGADELLRDGDSAKAGDRVQVAYTAGGQTHGVILSIDGGGSVTLHFPDREDGDTALQGGRRTFLPRSFELDQAPLFERFFFITASEPLPTAELLKQARQLAGDPGKAMAGRLDIPGRFGQFSFLVRK